MNKNGILKIGDFGSAIFSKNKVDGKFPIEGFSRWYKAPEMILGSRSYDQSVDNWSLGCIYAELLQGVPLFKGNNEIDQISRILKLLGSPTQENWSVPHPPHPFTIISYRNSTSCPTLVKSTS